MHMCAYMYTLRLYRSHDILRCQDAIMYTHVHVYISACIRAHTLHCTFWCVYTLVYINIVLLCSPKLGCVKNAFEHNDREQLNHECMN